MKAPEAPISKPSTHCDQRAHMVSRQETPADTAAGGATEKHVHRQILKSSAVIGSSSLANVAVGAISTKVMAVLLDPAGFGLMSLYGAIADLAKSIASMGVTSSGVRQMAEAAASGEEERLVRTAYVLRRMTALLGLLGGSLLILFAGPLSTLTFASEEHAGEIALLSLAVFFACISGGQGALIQGLRRIADLAKMGILGSAIGAAFSIAMVALFRERGVVPSLVGMAAVGMVISWWYVRKIPLAPADLNAVRIGHEAAALLKLGFAFLASALMTAGAAYVVRLIVAQEAGVEAAGLYQSAWTLGGLYVGFILQAMGVDFFPRLTGIANDHPACNRLVNDQARISLLLAGPGILATLTFAPLVVDIFYSARFQGAVEILRWICLGMALRIIIWPIGFIILAKGAQRAFFWTEAAWTAVYLALTWGCVGSLGAKGAGIAFFASYLFHGIVVHLIVRQLSEFRWQRENRRMALGFVSMIALVFCSLQLLPPLAGIAVGTLATAASAFVSLRTLLEIVPLERFPGPMLRLLSRLRLLRRDGEAMPPTAAAQAPVIPQSPQEGSRP